MFKIPINQFIKDSMDERHLSYLNFANIIDETERGVKEAIASEHINDRILAKSLEFLNRPFTSTLSIVKSEISQTLKDQLFYKGSIRLVPALWKNLKKDKQIFKKYYNRLNYFFEKKGTDAEIVCRCKWLLKQPCIHFFQVMSEKDRKELEADEKD